jgi:hypothetical protein
MRDAATSSAPQSMNSAPGAVKELQDYASLTDTPGAVTPQLADAILAGRDALTRQESTARTPGPDR